MADIPLDADEIARHVALLDAQRRPIVAAPLEPYTLPKDALWDIEAVLRHCFPDASDDVIKAATDRLEEIQWQYADNRELDILAGEDQ